MMQINYIFYGGEKKQNSFLKLLERVLIEEFALIVTMKMQQGWKEC